MKDKHKEILPRLGAAFRNGAEVKSKGATLGKGLFESDLINWGFKKQLLRDLAAEGVILKVTTTFQGGWRNTYVLPPTEYLGEDS